MTLHTPPTRLSAGPLILDKVAEGWGSQGLPIFVSIARSWPRIPFAAI